jgi:hypothetical protein
MLPMCPERSVYYVLGLDGVSGGRLQVDLRTFGIPLIDRVRPPTAVPHHTQLTIP